jgi:L,D-transpeptidase-like protein
VANVSYLRSSAGARSGRTAGGSDSAQRPSRRGRYVLGGVMLVVVGVVAVGALVIANAHASLTADSNAIAKVGMPLGGGSIQSVTVVTGPHSQRVRVKVTHGNQIWPQKAIPANQKLEVDVVVKRPGWIGWLAGHTEKLRLTMMTPVASLRSHYLTVRASQRLMLHFKQPIRAYSYGPSGHLRRHVLAHPESAVPLPRSAAAGSTFVSAQPRRWEASSQALVSWFPAGGKATVVASPSAGTTIKPTTPITLNFSKPVSKVLGAHLPPISPAQGSWHTLNSHAIVFEPRGYGYGLASTVHVGLPNGVRLIGGQAGSTATGGSWTVPGGSTTRLQQMLATLGYLPLNFRYSGSGVGTTEADQLQAAVKPPAGKFSWKYSNTPAALKGFWEPGAYGTVTKGALMAFENDHDMLDDGVAGPTVWHALIDAMIKGDKSSFGYTFVSVDEASQSLTLWHSGRTVISGTPVNTGIASAPTAAGTFPVYEHLPVTTMSGTNPDGSHYSDPGIPDVSYFNGGDALHGFLRAQYGFPQSLGCVEMPYSEAAAVYPYTPVGTLVHVE